MINNSPITQIHVIQQHQFKHRRRLQKILQSKPSCNNSNSNTVNGGNQYNFSSSFLHMLETRRYNHEKWREFSRNRERETLIERNQKMFNKLINITVQQGPYAQKANKLKQITESQRASRKIQISSQNIQQTDKSVDIIEQDSYVSSNSKRFRSTSLHHNYQVQNIKKSKIIDEQNPKLAQRLMEKTGYYDHIKDLQEFRKTREIVHRLQKFQQIQRILNSTKKKQVSSSEVKIRSKTLPTAAKQPSNNAKTDTQYPQKQQTSVKNIISTKPHKAQPQTSLQKASYSSSNPKLINNINKIASFRNRKVQQRRYRTIQSIKEQNQFISEEFHNKNSHNNNSNKNVKINNSCNQQVQEIFINQDSNLKEIMVQNNRDGF